jgi:2-polyprenyl-3-methyl-5-hydroxy-6-metoxy-1,4-benzoquinol methylase
MEDSKGKVLSAQSEIYIQKDLYNKRVTEIAFPKAKFASDLIAKKGKWIDIGAGVGDLVVACQKLGWDSIGYESDQQEVQFAQLMGSNVVHQFLTPTNMGILGGATVVSTINVLEHILDPKSLVNAISKNLKNGSYFLFEVPRFPSLSSLANRCFPNLAARNIYSPDHLHLFTDKSAKIMLSEANLETEAIWFFGQDVYELLGNCLAVGSFKNHHLIDSALEMVNKLQTVIDENGLADTMLVLARKDGE